MSLGNFSIINLKKRRRKYLRDTRFIRNPPKPIDSYIGQLLGSTTTPIPSEWVGGVGLRGETGVGGRDGEMEAAFWCLLYILSAILLAL